MTPIETSGGTPLVIGATGNVGKELTKQLVNAGKHVRILVRDLSKVADPWNASPLVEPVVGDLDKPDTLQRAMVGIKKMFLITGSTQQDRNVLMLGRGLDYTTSSSFRPKKRGGFQSRDMDSGIMKERS